MSHGWLSPLSTATLQGLPGDAPGHLGLELGSPEMPSSVPGVPSPVLSFPWPSLGHSRASLGGTGGLDVSRAGEGGAELPIRNEGSPAPGHHQVPALGSQQGWGALGPPTSAGHHQHPSAPPNPHRGSCSPSWEVSSRGLVPPVGLEVQKRSSLGSVEAPGRSCVAPWAPSPVFVFEAAVRR